MTETLDDPLPDFPVTVSQPVQWGEQDGFGHVNNMHFIRWFESSRIAYLMKCRIEMTGEGIGPILAAVSCNYRRQLTFPDTVTIGTRVVRIGRTSLTMEHALWSESLQAVAADGTSTVVMFDYASQSPSEVSSAVRNFVETLEKPGD